LIQPWRRPSKLYPTPPENALTWRIEISEQKTTPQLSKYAVVWKRAKPIDREPSKALIRNLVIACDKPPAGNRLLEVTNWTLKAESRQVEVTNRTLRAKLQS
jgi:hypothetical protein